MAIRVAVDGLARDVEHDALNPGMLDHSRSVPNWWPSRFYYGWALVWTLGFTEAVSYGILTYAFGVFIVPMTHEFGWSNGIVTGAYSLAMLVMGVCAIPAGAWADRHGTRALMTAGSLLASVLILAWARVSSVAGYYAVWTLMGFALSAVLYEPAFVVITTWFKEKRSGALTVLTFTGGFASVIFVPLGTWLVSVFGWRAALVRAEALRQDCRGTDAPACDGACRRSVGCEPGV
ncbi:MAG: MFS transporter [Gemmatimonadota bacterium]|nr:MFS transporter [Gemmatimonadota bacterium]